MTYLYVFIFCPFGRALSDTRRTPYSPAAVSIYPVQRVQRPGVCVGALPVVGGLPCIWHGLRCCLCCVVCPGALWAGVSTGGVYSHRPAQPGECRDKIFQRKRRFLGSYRNLPTPSFLCKTPQPTFPIPKIPPKNKKTPTKGLCSVLYLPYKP